MASGTDVDNALADAISAAMYPHGASVALPSPVVGVPVKVDRGWPLSDVLDADLAAGVATITIFPRPGLTRSTTRWASTVLSQTFTAASIGITPESLTIPPMGSASFTFLGSAADGDAVGVVVANGKAQSAVSTNLSTGLTADESAALLAGVINTAAMPGLGTATSAGPVVTLVSTSAKTLVVCIRVGNGGTQIREIGRRCRELQVILWTPTPQMRDVIGPVIESTLTTMEADYGLTLPDGTMGRLLTAGDTDMDQGGLAGDYRRDFLLSIDYAITTRDALFALLAPVINAHGSYLTERFVLDGTGQPILDGDGNPVLTATF